MNSLMAIVMAAMLPVPAPGSLSWQDCGEVPGAQCTTMSVPVDWSHPGGEHIDLPIARRAATDQANRVGTLVFGPGGPWDSGVSRVRDGFTRFTETLRARFDIVSWDPRGSLNGKPTACEGAAPTDRPQPPMVLTSQADFDATLAWNRSLWAGCSLLHDADMLDNLRDLDAIRAALGERQISFHGSSYGTLMGEQYAERYPGRVRAMVLESVDDHSVRTTGDFLTTQAAAFEDAFDDFADWCDATSCPISEPSTREVWHGLITSSRTDYVPFDLIAMTLRQLKDVKYAELATYLKGVADGGPARRVTDLGVVVPAFCGDWKIPVRDFAEYQRLLRRAAAVAPDTRYPAQVFALTMCLGWDDVANPQHRLHVRTATPLLLLNSRHDPATGWNWAHSVERQLGRHGVLVTYEGAGHGPYFYSPCIKAIADAYLISKTVPARGTSCPAL